MVSRSANERKPNHTKHPYSMQNIKNYIVTHLESGVTRRHAGTSPTQLTSGEISAETIAAGNYIPEFRWNPNPAEWLVEEQ